MSVKCSGCGREIPGAVGAPVPILCDRCAAASAAEAAAPRRLGRYDLGELLGCGGMGMVYKAVHRELRTAVAIKVLRSRPGPGAAAEDTERFLREARVAAQLRHPGIVRVHDVATEAGCLYMVMDFVEGQPLDEVLAAGPLDVRRSVHIAARLAEALRAAHARGVIHRDIKPANILIDARGEPLLLDFGISRLVSDDRKLTQTGDLVGTPAYMAPEQLTEPSDAIDARADVYALGVVLYEMLTGISPMKGENVLETLRNVDRLDPPAPSTRAAGVPKALDALVLKAMSRQREARPADMGEFLRALVALGPLLPKSVAVRSGRALPSAPAPATAATLRAPAGHAGSPAETRPRRRRAAAAAAVSFVVVAAAAWAWHERPERRTVAPEGPAPAAVSPPAPIPPTAPGAGPGSPPAPPGPTPPVPTQALAAIRAALAPAGGPAVRARRDHLLDGIQQLAGAATAEALYWRGLARKYVADFARARADLDAACRLGWAPAARERQVAWLYEHTLLTALVEEGTWLRADSPAPPSEWGQDGNEGRAARDRDLILGCAALATQQYEVAARRLVLAEEKEKDRAEEAPDRLVLLALARLLQGHKSEALDAMSSATKLDPGYAPVLLLRARLGAAGDFSAGAAELRAAAAPGTVEQALVAAVADCERLDAAALAADLQQVATAGSPYRARTWRAALLLRLRALEDPRRGIEAAEARALLRELEPVPAAEYPSVVASRLLLHLALDEEEQVRECLRSLPDHPAMEELADWNEAQAKSDWSEPAWRGLALLLAGRVERARLCLDRFVAAGAGPRAPEIPPRELDPILVRAYEALAAAEVLLGRAGDEGGCRTSAGRLAESLRRGGELREFSNWMDPFADRADYRVPLQQVALDAARRAAQADAAPDRVLRAVRLARRWGAPWTLLAQDPAFAPLHALEGWKSLDQKGPEDPDDDE